jgi:5,10-methylene-tetrahydrofolate dehydrogenase/methenyl tetrahydrofolate cyclohydrolase
MTILDGKKTAQDLKEEIKVAVSEIKKWKKTPSFSCSIGW